ncbi:MAG: hypothetical protein RJA63_458 [Pseudomonadota bacterium]|nr:hypothetical protein [Uliginosibacterium sp.]
MHETPEFTLPSGTTYKSQLPDDLPLAAAAGLLKDDYRTRDILTFAEVPKNEKRPFLCALAAGAFVAQQERHMTTASASPGQYHQLSPEMQQRVDTAAAWAFRPDSGDRPLTVESFARDAATSIVCLGSVRAGSQMPEGSQRTWTDAFAVHGAEYSRLRTTGHTPDEISAALAQELTSRRS